MRKWRLDLHKSIRMSSLWWRLMLTTVLVGLALFATHHFCTAAYCLIAGLIFEILSMRAANRALQIEKLQLRVVNHHLMEKFEDGSN
jgi:hypothetical protein|tara:strand:+ start:190 stop:450 length:261 start_codon:yes stop_codon:yes gene_type:complete